MKIKSFLAIVVAVGLLSACDTTNTANTETSATKSPDVTLTDLTHHRFELTQFNGQPVDAKKKPTVEFGENNTISGAMCNRYTGSFKLDTNVITASNLAMTRMLCPEEVLNKLDFLFGDILSKGATVALDAKVLTLSNGDNKLVFELNDLVN